MSIQITAPADEATIQPANWGGVLSMTLCVFALIASEFMPVSLLTPIAGELGVSEGTAGQAIAISGAFAVLTSLFISYLAGNWDRKVLLLLLTALMIVSGTIVAIAPNYEIFMIGRALIGVVIGGFWSMSAAIAMRLVPEHLVPRALAIFNSGNALATVVAPPLGAFLGSIIGWRGAFFTVVPVAVVAFLWQSISLPPMKPVASKTSKNAFRLLKRPLVAIGMISVSVFFMGQFSLFTYVRPFLESVTKADVTTLTFILLGIGLAGVAGTSLIGYFLGNNLYRVLIVIPALMAIVAATLIAFGSNMPITALALFIWGMIATAAPVGWWTWLARSLPQDAEAGGGLMVAVVQLAITLGAVIGGLLYDTAGYRTTFIASAALLVLASALAFRTSKALS
ncbi:MFS transporter [Agrobacterium sp. BA1120]|uniref:MFS transporter n=1 Tax=Agrobacterium sp. BA1120 TaxID=3228927 RepID=UPI00336A3C28